MIAIRSVALREELATNLREIEGQLDKVRKSADTNTRTLQMSVLLVAKAQILHSFVLLQQTKGN